MISSCKFLSQKAAARPGTWDNTGGPKKTKLGQIIRCILWPDEIPTGKQDVYGVRFEHLTYILPVYSRQWAWFWLAECDCGNEAIVKPYFSKSCGCRMKNKPTFNRIDNNIKVHERPLRFDRVKHCTRFPFKCAHYEACLEERVFSGTASLYVASGCYVPTAEESKLKYKL